MCAHAPDQSCSLMCLPHNAPGFTPVTYVKRTLLGDVPPADVALVLRALMTEEVTR